MQVENRLDKPISDTAGIRGVIAKVGQRQLVDSCYLQPSGQGHQHRSQVSVIPRHSIGWTIARFRGLDKASHFAPLFDRESGRRVMRIEPGDFTPEALKAFAHPAPTGAA